MSIQAKPSEVNPMSFLAATKADQSRNCECLSSEKQPLLLHLSNALSSLQRLAGFRGPTRRAREKSRSRLPNPETLSACSDSKAIKAASAGAAPRPIAHLEHFVAGLSASFATKLLLQPFDTAKTVMQGTRANMAGGANMAACMRHIVVTRGGPGLYTGLLGSMATSAPSTGVFVTVYETVKATLTKAAPGTTPFAPMVAALVGNMVASVVRVPPEVVKQRVQMGLYPNMLSACGTMWREGGVRAFYLGYWAQLIRDIPYSALQFATFEALKARAAAEDARIRAEDARIRALEARLEVVADAAVRAQDARIRAEDGRSRAAPDADEGIVAGARFTASAAMDVTDFRIQGAGVVTAPDASTRLPEADQMKGMNASIDTERRKEASSCSGRDWQQADSGAAGEVAAEGKAAGLAAMTRRKELEADQGAVRAGLAAAQEHGSAMRTVLQGSQRCGLDGGRQAADSLEGRQGRQARVRQLALPGERERGASADEDGAELGTAPPTLARLGAGGGAFDAGNLQMPVEGGPQGMPGKQGHGGRSKGLVSLGLASPAVLSGDLGPRGTTSEGRGSPQAGEDITRPQSSTLRPGDRSSAQVDATGRSDQAGRSEVAPSGRPKWQTNLVNGAIAGAVASSLTNPLDVVKTRMMTHAAGASEGGLGASGSIQGTVRSLMANEGHAVFFRGIAPRLLYKVPASAVFLVIYEAIKLMLRNATEARRLERQRGQEAALSIASSSRWQDAGQHTLPPRGPQDNVITTSSTSCFNRLSQ